MAYDQLGRHCETIRIYEQAIRIEPSNPDVYFLLGIAYNLLGDKKSALDQCRILGNLDAEKAADLIDMIQDSAYR